MIQSGFDAYRVRWERFQLERIYATPFHWNGASCRALEKASFNKEGTMRRAAIKNGELADVPLYARYRADETRD